MASAEAQRSCPRPREEAEERWEAEEARRSQFCLTKVGWACGGVAAALQPDGRANTYLKHRAGRKLNNNNKKTNRRSTLIKKKTDKQMEWDSRDLP